MLDLIEKKRDGANLTEAEIRFLIQGYVQGEIPDYQMSAWAMTVFFQGMNPEEIAQLTQAMAASGDQLELSALGRVVDKHSTGGVGDKTTLVLGPLVASCGVPVAKMSGRGLGHTGGTIDKLASIPGFKTELSEKDFLAQVGRIGLAVVAQSANLVPADKALYALRDVTATVNSIPLIASSVMSKKIAAGAKGIVLDVKYGSGAFMKTLDDARTLGRTMVDIGNSLNRETIAVLSDMNQPLGYAVGNRLEVLEAIQALQGQGPSDLMNVCLELGGWMLVAGRKASDLEEGKERLTEALKRGLAWDKFLEFVAAQGGDVDRVRTGNLLLAPHQAAVQARESGYVQELDARQVGVLSMLLGAGRLTKESSIDPGAGVLLRKKAGERVKAGDVLMVLYSSNAQLLQQGLTQAQGLCRITTQPPAVKSQMSEVIR